MGANASKSKTYLGDGVYVTIEYNQIVLTTENGGAQATNQIILEPEVYEALQKYVENCVKNNEMSA